MSMRMSFCLKAIKTLNDSDLGSLTDGIESYVKAGMETRAAERAAVSDMLAQVAEDRKELMGLIEQQHPTPVAKPEPVKPRTMFDPDIPFMRKDATAGERVEDVQAIVDAITDTWANAPDVVVLETFDQAPASVKAMNDAQLQGEAKGVPAAFVSGGKVYIVADQMTSDGGVVRALFHEALGHLGLRGTFGPKLGVILDELADANQEQVAAKAKQYGLDMTKAADRRSAAEEVLAEMAEKSPDATWVQRAIAAVKDFLRKLGIKLKYSDADIVAQFIVPARRFVTEGAGKPAASDQEAMARVPAKEGAADQTETPEFRKWFGNSKVVDADGKPLVVYHSGTFDESVDSVPRVGGEGFHFGTKASADERDIGKRVDDSIKKSIKVSEDKTTNGGVTAWFWYADGFDSYELDSDGFPSQEAAQASAEQFMLGKEFTDTEPMPQTAAYLSIKNPKRVADQHDDWTAAVAQAKAEGHDGIVYRNNFEDKGKDSYIAFTPEQIKSAIGNRGTFDPNDPRITFMRLSDIRNINQEKARNLFLDAVTSHGNVSFWGKTVGTQYHKAKKNPQTFGKVFTAVQDYIKDISVFANAAADKAPTILPKLENWTDLKKGGLTRHGADKKDLKTAGAAVFQGTLEYLRGPDGKLVQVDAAKNLSNRMNTEQKGRELMKAGKVSEKVLKMWQGLPQDQFDTIIEGKYDRDMLRAGVVFTDAELKSLFKLTPDQIGLYREFRAATDQSLDDLVRTEMVRLAGKGEVPLAQEVMAAPSIGAALKILQDHLDRLSVENPGDKADNDKTFNLIADKVGSVERLKSEGYAPLMRFGRHTLHIQKEGETVFFSMYESRGDANEAAREMRKDTEFQGAEFKQGLMSQEAYKLYAGMSMEALELFAESTGNANNPVYQDYLKLAKSNRSAMKRMIHRQGIAGFSEDASRVLASFVTSNSRMAAGNLHLGAAKEAAEAIPKEMGDLKDDAINLVKYVQDPQEEAAAVRGLLFTTFIGGSVASAVVNLTQPMTMTLPYLIQFGGAIKAGRHILAATRMAAGGKVEGEIAEALKRAEADGIVSPQEIHHIQAEAMGRLGAHPMLKKFSFIWGSMFSLAEQFNRRVSFISAYNVAKENHLADPFAFAEQAVIETQGLYNKGNKANWARGPIGATAMTFKQFSTHYLEFLLRMATAGEPGSKERRDGRKAVGVALAILVLVAGAGGLPFADDLDDLIDTLAQSMGYNFNAKDAKRKFISETLGLGDTAADLVTRGATSLPGMPIDLSVRMGLGNLLPGTGALLRSNTDRSRDVLEFAGAAGGLAKNAMDAGNLLLQGEITDAAIRMAPVALQNMAKSVQMWNTGQYRNQKDQKVTDVDQIDAAAKFVGFQPRNVASDSASMGRIQRSIQLARNVEEQIAGKWAQGANDLDQEKVAEARRELADWNEKNPSTPINITSSQIIARVRAMRMSRADRTTKAAPKELRPMVREGFQ